MKLNYPKEWYMRSAEIEGEAEVGAGCAFDGVSRDPIDRAAAMMFAKGTKAPSVRMGTMNHWETCPPVFDGAELKRRNVQEDLTGTRQGRMVVVGLAREIAARWIMRCDCGDYEPRKAKAIKNPQNVGECCTKCRQVVEAKRAHEFHATGRNAAERYRMNNAISQPHEN